MTVLVVMVMFVIMRMVMVVVMLMSVIMSVIVPMIVMMVTVAGGGGATLRLERRLDRLDLRSEGLQCLFKRRIAAQAHTIFLYLDRYVTVAEVPGQSRERYGIFDAHFEKRLGFCDDFH